MARTADPTNPRCPRCGHTATVRKGHSEGRQRWSCGGCQRSFGATPHTPLYRLRTPVAEVAQALVVVLRRGSLAAAEEVTGHKYETIGRWLRQAAAHAAVLTDVLAHDLHLTEVEVDEFWSFVHHKGGRRMRPTSQSMPAASAGAA